MSSFFVVAFVACGLLDVMVALDVLRDRDGEEALGFPRVVRAGLSVAILALVQALVLAPFGLHVFGIMHLAWIVLAYVVPLCGLVVWLDHLRGRQASQAARAVAAVALLAIPVAVSAQAITPFDLRLERVAVPLSAERAGNAPLRVGVLADLQAAHIGDHERDAVARLMAERPDLILVPGDLYHGPGDAYDEHEPAFRELLGQLQAPGGVWFVPGNTDYRAGLRALVEGAGHTLLLDAVAHARVGDRQVEILGIDEVAHSTTRRGHVALARFQQRDEAEAIRIVLAHRPRTVDLLEDDSRVDLVVAGHTHGGQVALPGLGPPLTLSPLPNHIGAGGLHERHGNLVYVSRGVGMERMNAPRIRLGVPPEITVLELGAPPAEARP